VPSVSYHERKAAWFAERSLKRHAGFFIYGPWVSGLSSRAIFSDWNFGLLAGGFGGFLTAVLLMTILYTCLCFSI